MSLPVPAVVVIGVSGTGKTTLAVELAASHGARFVEADDLHSAASRRKMASGVPLDDADRAPWLARVGRAIRSARAEGETVVVACSALKRAYRAAIRRAAGEDVWFVALDVPRAELERRMRERRGHFMPASLLDSQLATFEPLEPGEHGVTLPTVGDPVADARGARDALAAAVG